MPIVALKLVGPAFAAAVAAALAIQAVAPRIVRATVVPHPA